MANATGINVQVRELGVAHLKFEPDRAALYMVPDSNGACDNESAAKFVSDVLQARQVEEQP